MSSEVLNVILSHQRAIDAVRVLSWWRQSTSCEAMLLVHTGSLNEFAEIKHEPKIHVTHPRVATKDHQREMQSYTALFAEVSRFLRQNHFSYVYFSEYDHLPLLTDLNNKQIDLLKREDADVLAFHLRRVDGTSHAHLLYHRSDPRFMKYWQEVTVRSEPEVVLSMFGTGSFWTREAFLAVAEHDEPFPMYLEIYLPTLAHHLGFRVRDYGFQNQFVHNLGDRSRDITGARKAGAWTLHPIKQLET